MSISGSMGRAASVTVALLLATGAFLLLAPSPAAAGEVSVYMPGLDWPIALAFAPDGRIFFAERLTGNIRIIEGGNLQHTPFYTLTNTAGGGERGLLGLALDPDFPAAPFVYVYQTYDDDANGTIYNRIVRIVADGNAGRSHEVILRLPPLSSATNHNGGVIAFGPDDKLYAVVGENANRALSQDPMSPMGKVLRMNRDGSPPEDNPFYGDPNWNPLVYTYGHRNMFGLAFHPITNGTYVTENGPGCNDEVNLLQSGGNFGWGTLETCSTPPPPPSNTNQDGPNPVLPIWWWDSTICPTNAAAYGGPYFPAWRGDLFMGDCNFRRLHRLDLLPPAFDSVDSDTILWTAPAEDGAILDVEGGPDGAIWITTVTAIYRYAPVPPVPSFTTTPNPATVGTPVSFDASASYDPDGTIVSYEWDFGDNSMHEIGPIRTHIYTAPGRYNASLTTIDNESYPSTRVQVIEVLAPPPAPLPPVANFTLHPSPVAPGVAVTFDASNSSDPDGEVVTYAWNFGDTSTAEGKVTSHAYEERGTYTVSLRVTDRQNLNATMTRPIVVDLPPPSNVSPAGGELWPVVAVLLAIAGAAAFVGWRRRGRRR